ncbi:hypothetical protein VNI00_018830 [Paramarasmius palmivorus]|uniref:Uncharacterized protein n=1 Tax=Paramarasmius palmivorus TaxID=297713 RepID=A0AAW0AUU7_9AGAR
MRRHNVKSHSSTQKHKDALESMKQRRHIGKAKSGKPRVEVPIVNFSSTAVSDMDRPRARAQAPFDPPTIPPSTSPPSPSIHSDSILDEVTNLLQSAYHASVDEQEAESDPDEEDLTTLLRKLWSGALKANDAPAKSVEELCEENLDDSDHDSDPHDFWGIPGNTTATHRQRASTNLPFYLWPSRELYLTHLLFSAPRLRFSRAQKNAVLQWANEMGASNVPTLTSLKRCVNDVEELLGSSTKKVVTPSGNVLFVNDIAKTIAKYFANPKTRLHMSDYPEDGGTGASQMKHGRKWALDLPRNLLTLTVRVRKKLFFVGELLQCTDGRYFIPDRFYTKPLKDSNSEPKIYALGHSVTCTETGYVVNKDIMYTATDDFFLTYEDLVYRGHMKCGFSECSAEFAKDMPHRMREKANNKMVYGVPIIGFLDDVSANISKQWNKHHAFYASCGALPRELIEQEFFVIFVSSSPHVPPMEMIRAFMDCIRDTHDGILAYDCKYKEECLFTLHAHFLAGDNPMQAEEASQSSLNANHFCRTCDVGGTKVYKASEEGYARLFEAGTIRTPEKTQEQIKEQLRLATLYGAEGKIDAAKRETGTYDAASSTALEAVVELGKRLYSSSHPDRATTTTDEIRAKLEVEMEHLLTKYPINPLIGIEGFDVHLDTPMEILHTILLGVVKYFWGQTVHILEKAKGMGLFQLRLASLDASGLNIPNISAKYMCQYKGSLIGKHFKSIAQIMPFIVYDLVSKDLLDAWTIIGELVVLVWHTKIEDMDSYLEKLSTMITTFLNITAKCSLSILISKPKFHFLIHLPLYIHRFGPAILFSTEKYESYNHVFRLSSIFSNRQSPSRDSCQTFASQDIVKHIITGGYWFDQKAGKWVQAGSGILRYIEDNVVFQKLLGLNTETEVHPGTVGYTFPKNDDKESKTNPRTLPGVLWQNTYAFKVTKSSGGNNSPAFASEVLVQGSSVYAQNLDKIKIGSYALVESSRANDMGTMKLSVIRIDEILAREKGRTQAVAITGQFLDFADELHALLHLPCLSLSDQAVVCEPKQLRCAVNIQHDCSQAECSERQTQRTVQERIETTKTYNIVLHNSLQSYVMNTHALHNYQDIFQSIPAALLKKLERVPCSEDECTKIRTHAADRVRNQKKEDEEAKKKKELERAEKEAEKERKRLEREQKKANKATAGKTKKRKSRATQPKSPELFDALGDDEDVDMAHGLGHDERVETCDSPQVIPNSASTSSNSHSATTPLGPPPPANVATSSEQPTFPRSLLNARAGTGVIRPRRIQKQIAGVSSNLTQDSTEQDMGDNPALERLRAQYVGSTGARHGHFVSAESQSNRTRENGSNNSNPSGGARGEVFATPSRPSIARSYAFDDIYSQSTGRPVEGLPDHYQEYRAMLAATPTAAGNRRRQCPFDEPTPNTKCQLVEFSKEVATDLAVDPTALGKFAALPVAKQMIVLQGNHLAAKQEAIQKAATEAINGSTLKDRLSENLKACFTSPFISAYRIHNSKNIEAFVMENPDIFGIKKEYLDDQDFLKQLQHMIRKFLATIRGNMKTTIFQSLREAKNQPINKYSECVLGKLPVKVTLAHWHRYAFLRKVTTEFEALLQRQEKERLKELQAQASSASGTGSDTGGPSSSDASSSSGDSQSSVSGNQGRSTANSAGAADDDDDEELSNDEAATRVWLAKDFWRYVDWQMQEALAGTQFNDNGQRRPEAERIDLMATFYTKILQKDMDRYPIPSKAKKVLKEGENGPNVKPVWLVTIEKGMMF